MNSYRIEDYLFDLPDDRIAQKPAEPRDSSRLMVVDRATGQIQHRVFSRLARLSRSQRRLGCKQYQGNESQAFGTKALR